MQIEFPGGAKVCARYKGFQVLTDQPGSAGGDGEAPSPFDLFLISLGTCAGYYALIFCKEREIDIEGLSMTLKTEREKNQKLLKKIIVEMSLPPTFPKKYEKAIVAAVNSCTVKKHLFHPPTCEVMVTYGEGEE